MRCSFCEGEISATAKACRHCGRSTEVGTAEKRQGCAKWFAIIAGAAVVIFVGLVILGSSSPETDVDRCVRNKANGNWTGSMGVTLEQFCQAAVNLRALERDRQANPERY